MSIPIKAQMFGLDMYDESDKEMAKPWMGMIILVDGSIYGLDNRNKLRPLDRSYAGQLIKNTLKYHTTNYHTMCYEANMAKRRGNTDIVRTLRESATIIHDTKVVPLQKMWVKFRSMRKPKVIKPDSRSKAKKHTPNSVIISYNIDEKGRVQERVDLSHD